MKGIKIALSLSLAMLFTNTGAFKSAKEAGDTLKTKYIVVFQLDNFFDAENKFIKNWHSFMTDVQAFVDNNSRGNKLLKESMDLCHTLSREVTNSITLAYNSLFDSNQNLRAPSQNDINNVRKSLASLVDRLSTDARTGDIDKQKDLLRNTSYYLPGKVQSKTILWLVLNKLQDAMTKFIQDFGKKRPAQRVIAIETISKEAKALAKQAQSFAGKIRKKSV